MNPPLLLIQDLVKRFRSPAGEVLAVVEIPHFRMEAGEQLLLKGESGSGKTTFLHLISGVLSAESGRIDLGETRLSALNEAARDRLRAREIGYIFQNFNLLRGFSALENVLLAMRFGKGGDEARARELLQRVGLGRRLDYKPAQLSQGQKQRVAVARALANQPRLVLADEPTGSLDPKNAHEVVKLAREVAAEMGAGLLFVSHDPGLHGDFERVVDFDRLNRAAHGDGEKK